MATNEQGGGKERQETATNSSVMANKEQGGGGEEQQETTAMLPTNWRQSIENKYLEIRQHAEEYPYVWASYILVYGGIALWTGYRWRKLRRTEDRVRALQVRLRELVEAEDAAASSSTASIAKSPAKLVGTEDSAGSSSSTAPIAKPPAENPEKWLVLLIYFCSFLFVLVVFY